MVVTPGVDFAKLPEADKDPLETVLKNANGMYVSHAPSLAPIFYTCEQNIASRSAVFRFPIRPSADGLDYDFDHKIWAGTGAGTLTVLVEEWTGAAWNTLENTAAIAAAAGTSITHSHTDAINPSATMLRCTYTRVGADPFTPDSVHVRPGTQTLSSGTKASGFKAYDDGGLGGGSAGINEEHLNRGPQNAMAIYSDRAQAVFTYCQEDTLANALYLAEDGALRSGWINTFCQAMACIPWQRKAQLWVYVIADVGAGSGVGLVEFCQDGGELLVLDATGGVDSGRLWVKLQSPGQLSARALLRLQGAAAAGQSATIFALVAYWVPGQ